MNVFDKLKSELEYSLEQIEQSNLPREKKCASKVSVCQEVTEQLKQLFQEHELREDQTFQIHFFKSIKPRFCSEFVYQMTIYDYLKDKPKGSVKSQRKYIDSCMDKTSKELSKYSEFNNYIYFSSTHHDELYFTLQNFDPVKHVNLLTPTSNVFNPPAGPTLTTVIAMNRYTEFLKKELETLNLPKPDPSWNSTNQLIWKKSKTDLVQLVYALHATESVHEDLKDTKEAMEKLFNVQLGNIYRTFSDIKIKKEPDSFIKELSLNLLKKVRE